MPKHFCLLSSLLLFAGVVTTGALHSRLEISVPCREFVWESSPTVLYNLAFALSRTNALQDWVFAFESGSLTRTCVNASYSSAFDDPQILMRIDLARVGVRKTTCFSGGMLSEKVVVTGVPYFTDGAADISAARDTANPTHLRVSAAFDVATPWVFKLAESALEHHARSYLKRYTELFAQTVCT